MCCYNVSHDADVEIGIWRLQGSIPDTVTFAAARCQIGSQKLATCGSDLVL